MWILVCNLTNIALHHNAFLYGTSRHLLLNFSTLEYTSISLFYTVMLKSVFMSRTSMEEHENGIFRSTRSSVKCESGGANGQSVRVIFPIKICFFYVKIFLRHSSHLHHQEWLRIFWEKLLWKRIIVTFIYILRKQYGNGNDRFCKISSPTKWLLHLNYLKTTTVLHSYIVSF